MTRKLRIGIVAGEASGDNLGAGLIKAIQQQYPDATFEGIGGSQMRTLGFHTHAPLERLSVMGLVEVLGRLVELIKIRRKLLQYFLDNPPDVFVGIDAPDFNLALEKKLKQAGIKTVHYVSPQVWAWRQYRVKSIGESVDLILALFPFEAAFFQKHRVPVTFVGHPMADIIPMESSRQDAREQLGLGRDDQILALLPGSRMGEVTKLIRPFLASAKQCQKEYPECKILIAAANADVAAQIDLAIQENPGIKEVQVMLAQAQVVMTAADALLLASGTVTLEAALIKRPMVIAYKMAPLTHWILSRLVKTPYISLPNLLAGRLLVPEFIQDKAEPEFIVPALLACLRNRQETKEQLGAFVEIHHMLRQDASKKAAEAVISLINEP